MAHTLRALISRRAVVEAAASTFGARSYDLLPDGYGLLALTEELVAEVNWCPPLWDSHYEEIGTRGEVALLLAMSWLGPTAFVTTDYFGGVGKQLAIAAAEGECLGPSGSINLALSKVGAIAREGMDHFETLGLTAFRLTKPGQVAVEVARDSFLMMANWIHAVELCADDGRADVLLSRFAAIPGLEAKVRTTLGGPPGAFRDRVVAAGFALGHPWLPRELDQDSIARVLTRLDVIAPFQTLRFWLFVLAMPECKPDLCEPPAPPHPLVEGLSPGRDGQNLLAWFDKPASHHAGVGFEGAALGAGWRSWAQAYLLRHPNAEARRFGVGLYEPSDCSMLVASDASSSVRRAAAFYAEPSAVRSAFDSGDTAVVPAAMSRGLCSRKELIEDAVSASPRFDTADIATALDSLRSTGIPGPVDIVRLIGSGMPRIELQTWLQLAYGESNVAIDLRSPLRALFAVATVDPDTRRNLLECAFGKDERAAVVGLAEILPELTDAGERAVCAAVLRRSRSPTARHALGSLERSD